jgi:hypothetical protein
MLRRLEQEDRAFADQRLQHVVGVPLVERGARQQPADRIAVGGHRA